jgi:ATP-binding cassette, subfamily B, bacterial
MRRRWDRYWADAIEPRLFIIGQLRVASRWQVIALGSLNIMLGLLPICFVLATSVLIGRVPAAVRAGLHSPEWHALVSAFLLASAAFFAQQILVPLTGSLGEVLKHQVDGRFRARLVAVSLRPTGIAALEDQATLVSLKDASEQLEQGFRTPGDAANATLKYLARYTQLAGYLLLLGLAASWWSALAVFACTMSFRYGHRGGLRMWTRLWPVMGHHRRRSEYFRDVGLLAPAAKEVRVFDLSGWVTAEYRSSAETVLRAIWKGRRDTILYLFLVFTAVGLVIAMVVLAHLVGSAARGDISLTQLALGLQATIAAIMLGDYYHEADDRAQFGMMAARALDTFEKRIQEYADRDIAMGGTTAARGRPEHELCFDSVSFHYPGSDRPVLDHLDLRLRAGECTAIVGLNGAGKTTLVKLLARLYEPTAGTISVDGLDLRELDVDSWRAQIAVIFQDFAHYELSARDNISFGAVGRSADEPAVLAAAAKAGISQAIELMPLGLETILSRQYDDGAELSGGQWQRVAIARALYAVDAGARVLVLDEPTAALDVRAERAFFDEFAELTSGLTTVLISHRFSSVRHADRIVVLEHGRVIEDGTHDALVASGGRYSGLFALQAERFSVDGSLGDAEVTS